MNTNDSKFDSWDPSQKGYQRSWASEQMAREDVKPSAADLLWPHLSQYKFAKERELETKISNAAKSWVEDKVPYLWGEESRESADCSGSVWAIYDEAGYKFQRRDTASFHTLKEFREVEKPKVGDVVHYGGHMAVYAGKDSNDNDMVWSARGSETKPGKPFEKAKASKFGTPQKFYRYNLP